MHRPIALLVLAFLPRLLPAQILSLPTYSTEPGNFIGGGVSFLNATSFRDDSRNAGWNVNSVMGYRVSIDKVMSSGVTLGATVTWSNPAMVVSTTALGACPTTCQASASFQHYQLAYRSGGSGRGTWPVAELAIGGLRLSDAHANGASIAPDRTVFTTSAGFGVAFATSNIFQFEVVQEYTSIFAGGGFSGAGTQWSTRVGIRYGFGNRD
ncbi:MAG: hypothetical protein HY275_05690 [Gemmatimonadetes bacterium]|nr:hypothetical protein [Gemmatimonadota bacterium]